MLYSNPLAKRKKVEMKPERVIAVTTGKVEQTGSVQIVEKYTKETKVTKETSQKALNN